MEIFNEEITDISGGKFGVTDYVIFCLMLLVSLGVGLYSSFKKDNSTTDEFLVGGRSMSIYPVALSLVGGAISAVSILGLYNFNVLLK